jgi:hypothetical protein
MAFGNSSSVGSYSPVTFIFDIGELQEVDVTSPQFKELLIRLYQNLNTMANVVNVKESAYYIPNQEFLNGQQWFPNPSSSGSSFEVPNRQDYRTVLNFGTLAPGTTSVNHNIPITSSVTFTQIYGTANDTIGKNYYPLPWASSAGATNIEIKVNATQVTITNNTAITFNICYCVLEYLKF